MIDLHIHTVASDGQHTGSEIVAMAANLGLTAIAVADHNSVDSVAEAQRAAAEAQIDFAPAIELDTIFRDRDLHVLGYFIDYDSEPCRQYLREIFDAKLEQTRRRVRKLNELGFHLDFDRLLEESGGRLPYGVEYMRVLLQDPAMKKDPRVRQYIDGPRANSPYLNFYLDWLKSGRPAFVPLEVQTSTRAIDQIHALHGVAVLAHPSDTPPGDVHELIDHGLDGIEVYCSYHDAETAETWRRFAADRAVLITAGSDFHGKDRKPDVLLGGVEHNPQELFDRLRRFARS